MSEAAKIIGNLWDRFKTSVMLGVLAVAVVMNVIYTRLSVYWSDREIVLFFCIGPILLLLLLITFVSAIYRAKGRPMPSIPQAFRLKQTPIAVPFDWVSRMNEVYNPSRRLPALPIGINATGQFVGVSMRTNESHIMTVGGSGSGKSNLVNQVILAAHNSALYQVVVYTIKPGDFALVENLKNVHLVKYDNKWDEYASDMPYIIKSINDEIQRRMARLSQLGKADIWEMRAEQRPPLFLLVIEELGDLVNRIQVGAGRKVRDEFLLMLKNCLDIGRAAGVHLFLVDQRPTGNIPLNIRVATIAIPFRVKNRQEAYWATGSQDSGAETLQPLNKEQEIPPEVVIVGPLGNQRLKVPWFTAEDIHMLIRLSDQEGIKRFDEPVWLYGYTPQEPQITAEGTMTAPMPETPILAPSSPRRGEVLEHIRYLYETDPEFRGLTDTFYLERGQLAALGGMAGMSQNAVMRGIFNKQTNGKYRAFLGLINGRVEGWLEDQAGQGD